MNRIKTMIKVILCCIALILVMKYKVYDDYWSKVGRTYSDMCQLRGEPVFIEEISDTFTKCHYKNASYSYGGLPVGLWGQVNVAGIEDKNVRFGLFGIGIGTPRSVVETVYCLKRKEKSSEPNKYCVIDGMVRIIFEFDEADRVKTMYISDSTTF